MVVSFVGPGDSVQASSRRRIVAKLVKHDTSANWRVRPELNGERLKWVHSNRSKPDPTGRLGSSMRKFCADLGPRARVVDRIVAAVGRLVDAEFLCHCRLAGLARGTLTISVDQPGMVWSMRRRWALNIRDGLARLCRPNPVTQIVFISACEGIPPATY